MEKPKFEYGKDFSGPEAADILAAACGWTREQVFGLLPDIDDEESLVVFDSDRTIMGEHFTVMISVNTRKTVILTCDEYPGLRIFNEILKPVNECSDLDDEEVKTLYEAFRADNAFSLAEGANVIERNFSITSGEALSRFSEEFSSRVVQLGLTNFVVTQ